MAQERSSSSNLFLNKRMRRLRHSQWMRDLVTETRLNPADLIWPLFVLEGEKQKEDVSSMPGVQRTSIDLLIEKVKEARDLGISAVALFPVVDQSSKSENAQESYSPDNLMCRAIAAVKAAVPDMGIIADVALDPYTSHGHDGLLDSDGYVMNDETVEVLMRQAVVQASAGADIIAPSDMMDGRVEAIRGALDTNGNMNTAIMSYAAKYASAFYGPFRDAVGSSSALKGDKKTYQMNSANKREALHEVALDIEEGADMVMVKPGLAYLDIVKAVKDEFQWPTFAYHVSGEYAMLKAASDNGWLDYDAVMFETLLGFKRAGCDGILTYCALDAAKLLK
ncbi:MAG: delta-aminolevulinic acid dehydratase [Micavibrio sp. TMED27]|nr:porphobilinogen synthase [Micavibrio sp.]OUT92115.1 MAG: delta-aminolevulinic acid dehydratase [Micavibrio sp. TMED27]|tara:strand:+ start:929 stop:1939 length:1011 start_codon:yes stop_codon:yes gene_type:complete